MSKKKKEIEPVALDLRVTTAINPVTKIVEEIPDLDPVWVEDVQFVPYTPPPVQLFSVSGVDHGVMEGWIERMILIRDDLKWLLCLPHNKFWCQVIFDETLQQCLDSYLRFSPRNFDAFPVLSSESLKLQENIHKRVFMAYLRMSTHKESKMDFITPNVFGDIIYENFLFDIPKLMDICTLYGGEESSNTPLVSKMMENIFSKQPRYHEDLLATIPTIYQTLDDILSRCGLKKDTDEPSDLPQKLDNRKNGPKISLSVKQLEDIVCYLHDIGKTLSAFLCTYPPNCFAFYKEGFVQRIAAFYELVVPYFRERSRTDEGRVLQARWRHVKMMLVKLCHVLLHTCCIEPVSISSDEQVKLSLLEGYLQVFTSVLSEKRFLSSYDAQYSIQGELAILQKASEGMDETRVDYILAAVESARQTFSNLRSSEKNRLKQEKDVEPTTPPSNNATSVTNHLEEGSAERNAVNGLTTEDQNTGAAISKTVNDVELFSMVSHVQDLLPGLGDGFVMRCLEEHNYNVEQVINLLLEDNLPRSLQDLDRNMSGEEVLKSKKQQPKTLVDQRHCVYDQDEFDVFSGSKIDVSKVHKGKRRDRENLKSMLADKSHITDSVKERYSAYDVFGKLRWRETMYDDEYDDTYDSQNVGALDADSADERADKLIIRRPFTTPRALGGSPEQSDDEDTDDENETVEESRETRETKENHPHSKKTNNKGSEKDHNSDTGKPRGKGKDRNAKNDEGNGQTGQGTRGGHRGRGRGVSTSELRNRAHNERHKGSHANHNRKAGAERKRNKGMGMLPQR